MAAPTRWSRSPCEPEVSHGDLPHERVAGVCELNAPHHGSHDDRAREERRKHHPPSQARPSRAIPRPVELRFTFTLPRPGRGFKRTRSIVPSIRRVHRCERTTRRSRHREIDPRSASALRGLASGLVRRTLSRGGTHPTFDSTEFDVITWPTTSRASSLDRRSSTREKRDVVIGRTSAGDHARAGPVAPAPRV